MECLNCYQADMVTPVDEHAAYMVCPACGAIELTYEPQDYQIPMHTVPYRYVYNPVTKEMEIATQVIGVFGGYGSGKSRASLTEVLLRALENPKGTGLLTAPTLQQLKRTTLKTFFNEVCPPSLIENYNKSDGEITLVNGFVFYTIPSDDEEKIRSINAGIIHIEEASGIKRTIYDQLLTRMRDPFVKNKLMMVCSNPDIGWIRDVIYLNEARKDPNHPEHDEYNPNITCFVWETALNKYLPPDYIEMNSKNKPEWWIKRYLKGSMEHSEGMVYPNFSRCLWNSEVYFQERGLKEIPKTWEKFVTLDHGLRNPTAFYIHAINPDTGEVVTYMEHYKAELLVPQHAKIIKPMMEQEIPMGKLRFAVADPSIKNRTDPINGKSVLGLYQEYGIYFTEGNNDITAGILKVNSYIESGKWVIFQDKCPNLAKEGIKYKFPELTMDNTDENLDEKPVKAHDHAMDSCFIAGTLIETDKGQVPIEKIKIGDKVLTRQGYFPVIDWGITSRDAVVYTVKFSNGSQFTATGNHPVWVEGKGFCTVDSLRYGDIIKVSPNWEDLVCLMLSIPANTVEQSLWQTDTTKEDTAPVHVVSVHIENQRQTVYNLTVDCVPEYYANGVLVHNCRYGFMRLPDDPELLKTLAYNPPTRYSRSNYSEYDEESEHEYTNKGDWYSYV